MAFPERQRIPTTTIQLLIDILHFGTPLDEAFDRSRFHVRRPLNSEESGNIVDLEDDAPAEFDGQIAALRWHPERHKRDGSYFGGGSAVLYRADGRLQGVADLRRTNCGGRGLDDDNAQFNTHNVDLPSRLWPSRFGRRRRSPSSHSMQISTARSLCLVASSACDDSGVASSVSGNTVTLIGRDNFNNSEWKWIYFQADGVNGQQVTFKIGDDFNTGGSSLNNHRMVYSYDQKNWSLFRQQRPHLGSEQIHVQQQFAVHAGHGLRRVRPALSVSTNGRSHRTRSRPARGCRRRRAALATLVVAQSPGGVDDIGRTVTPKNLYGYKITDSSYAGPKRKIVLMGGVHANETLGNFTLEGLVDFLGERRTGRRSASPLCRVLRLSDGQSRRPLRGLQPQHSASAERRSQPGVESAELHRPG